MKAIRGVWSLIWLTLLFCVILIPVARTAPFSLGGTSPGSLGAESGPKTDNPESTNRDVRIPDGTILPIRLGSVSSEKTKKGDLISARIMQDVPLENGTKLRAGSRILGRIIDVNRAGTAQKASLAIKFDAIVQGKDSITVTTHLRAIASALEIEFAQVPPIGPGESDVYDWLPTRQIGGEVVYGKGGEVYRGLHVVGRSVYDGVLAQANANEGSGCRGPVAGNDRPQAFWVFSSDACGAYGFPSMTISAAGRTDPLGVIVLVSERGPLKIRSGSGMLLRVED